MEQHLDSAANIRGISMLSSDINDISEEDLTDEKVAESVLKNWAFIPKIFSLNRKDYLENCIFLLAWNSMFGEILSLYLRKKENQFSISRRCICCSFILSHSHSILRGRPHNKHQHGQEHARASRNAWLRRLWC